MNDIAIYGAGSYGKLFFKALNEKVTFFIDDFATNKVLCDIPIKKLSEISKDTKIYISILQHSKEIEQILIKDGYTNIINFTDSIFQMPDILKEISKTNYLWLVSDHKRMINNKKIKEVHTLLYDKRSKEILTQITNLRKTLDTKYYIKPSGIEYFPEDVPILNNIKNVNFIDCGAYTGDTIEELTKKDKQIGYTLSFEPDQKNLLRLNQQLATLKNKFPTTNFMVYPAGVYSKNDILKFSNNGIDSSASLDSSSSLEVPVVSLDNVILHSNPNFIKMDIEGAEKEALLGATKTIKKYKPNLAICLYHKPEDLWELPLLINKIEPSYEMYIRVHEDMCLSTVLYCITKDEKCIN